MCPLLPSGLAGSGSQEEGASLTFTGGITTGEGEGKRQLSMIFFCMLSVPGGLLLPTITFQFNSQCSN